MSGRAWLFIAFLAGIADAAGAPVCADASAWAQSEPTASLAPGITRASGLDADSGIAYVLLSVDGHTVTPADRAGSSAPRLTAQCTRNAAGKLRFELLATLEGAPPVTFVAPWRPSKESRFAPLLSRVTVTMEFLGYTKVKPVRRQWEVPDGLPEALRYATPGLASANMEPVTFYLQYLRSLPTLRLAVPGRQSVEFETSTWQQQVRAERLCTAAGL